MGSDRFCEACKVMLKDVLRSWADGVTLEERPWGHIAHHQELATFIRSVELDCYICTRLKQLFLGNDYSSPSFRSYYNLMLYPGLHLEHLYLYLPHISRRRLVIKLLDRLGQYFDPYEMDLRARQRSWCTPR